MAIPDSTKVHHWLFFWLNLIAFSQVVCGQTPFVCTGQVFVLLASQDELAEMQILPGNNSIGYSSINSSLGMSVNALGFRKTDNLLYGIEPVSHHLLRLDANGVVEDLGVLPLGNGLLYFAGDVSPDGKYLVCIGSSNGTDKMLNKIDLETANFTTTTVLINNTTSITDISFDPYTSKIFGFDGTSRSIISINASNGAMTFLQAIAGENDIQGLYFDAYGNLFALGTTAFGVANALFSIDKTTGKETPVAYGPLNAFLDVASCPFSVEISCTAEPETIFPCSEVDFTYSIANGSGQVLTGVDFEHKLPPGFSLSNLQQNPFGGTLDATAPPGVFRIKNMNISTGVHQISAVAVAGDIPKGIYKSQAFLKNLPVTLGSTHLSNNPKTPAQGDSTSVIINRIDEDVLYFSNLLCHGESLVLDASQFGNNLLWSNGSTAQQLTVTQGGVYTLQAESGCQTLTVTYEVTSASCPYTIELLHTTVPDTVFPCNQLIYRFFIDNDSGEKREGFSFTDTLPEGLTFEKVLRNPFGGQVNTAFPSQSISIANMVMQTGIDSMDLLVAVGDVPPGNYLNRATINHLPNELGPMRISDDPKTLVMDSTSLYVSGTTTDTTFIEDIICNGANLVLDASQFGKNYLWNDGSTSPQLVIKEPGSYQVTLFDGCEPSYVFYEIAEGTPISVTAQEDTLKIHLGEQVQFYTTIVNSGDSTFIEWVDPLENSLSCTDCTNPVAMPLETTSYTFKVSNGVCSDSVVVRLLVDNTRRVYAPNVFSPNEDGINDFFYLQSPDFGSIRSLTIADRWGDILFQSNQSFFNKEQSGWDGRRKGQPMPEGVYVWRAEITFLDEKTEVLFGNVAILK